MSASRPATPDDVHAICRALPEAELGTSWGDRPTYNVPTGPRGRGFVLWRGPRRDAIDPATGRLFTDLIVIVTGTPGDKEALVADPDTPFFTIPHFDGYSAVLVQESRLGEISREALEEVITEGLVRAGAEAAARRVHHAEVHGAVAGRRSRIPGVRVGVA